MKKLLAILVASMFATGAAYALNPQPLPPGIYSKAALNPQPLPPGIYAKSMLNPQPLPPLATGQNGKNMLNPQPLPPRR
jgi:hypothetical protein